MWLVLDKKESVRVCLCACVCQFVLKAIGDEGVCAERTCVCLCVCVCVSRYEDCGCEYKWVRGNMCYNKCECECVRERERDGRESILS
jgi:hypothetical protein